MNKKWGIFLKNVRIYDAASKKSSSNIRSHRTNSTLDVTADTSSSINRPRPNEYPHHFSPEIPVNGNRELYRFQLYRTNFSESYAQNTSHYLTQRQFLWTTQSGRHHSHASSDSRSSSIYDDPPSSLIYIHSRVSLKNAKPGRRRDEAIRARRR